MAGPHAAVPDADPLRRSLPSPALQARRLLASIPHRFFFLVGSAQIVLISLWWAWALAARTWPQLPAPGAAIAPATLHTVLMICGFAPFFMFGFLFTAGPRWLQVKPAPRSEWFPVGLVAAGAALMLVPLEVLAPTAGAGPIRIAAGVYAAAWLGLAVVFHRLIRVSEAGDKLHATLILIAMVVGSSSIAAFALAGPSAHGWVRSAGFWGFLLPVFVIASHRMIAFFTTGAVPFATVFGSRAPLAAMVGAPILHGAIDALGLVGWTWPVDLPIAALVLWLALRWGRVQSLSNRLIAMVRAGFFWYWIGFLLAGAHSLGVLAGGRGAPLAAMHALAVGFAASLMMAMVTRVTCGHSGRTLAADALTWRLFQLLQACALARVAAEVLPGRAWLVLAAVLWAAAFLPWCVKYGPVYWRPRADGRPG